MLQMSACKDSYYCLKDIITDAVINDLANKLRKQCYENGVEEDPKESAKTLHQLGLAYKEKSPDKISLIQSVALMTSAVLRDPDNADDIRKDLDDVCMHIMKLANAANPDVELVSKAVVETKAQIQIFRVNTKAKLIELKPISDDLKEEELNALRRQRVKKVRKIQDNVTKTYKVIVGFIAKQTLVIIGKEPCKFALVGMGSLAKNEVTPYSDLESIIVLEEGTQTRPDYKSVLEYFEWFATVYQMILVRLGETLLKFLAIPCLNNPLNKEEDWFYDAYTPCGISPDGFAPQASKNPLGRQTKTQKKPWTTELIKPVSEMVKYLETEEDLKNGYHLADMLTTTCFVFGDSIVSEEFESKVEQKLNQMPIFNQRAKQNIEKDYDLYQIKPKDLYGNVDIKRVASRSCSLFVLALGRLHKCNKLTCFDILDELLDRGLMNETLHGKLQFSVAVACEMRLRWYSKTSGQDDIVHHPLSLFQLSDTEYIAKDIGNRAVLSGINIAVALQHYIVNCFEEERSKMVIDVKESPSRAASLAYVLRVFAPALDLFDECKTSDEKLDAEDERSLQLLYVMCLLQRGEYEVALKICDDALTRLNSPSLIEDRVHFLVQCCICSTALNRRGQALKYIKMLSEVYSHGITDESRIQINMLIGYCHMSHEDYKNAQHAFDLAYNEIKRVPATKLVNHVHCYLLSGFNECLNRVGCFDKALSVNEELISERRKQHVDEETDSFLNLAFYYRCAGLNQLKRYEEALVYCEKALKWKTSERADHVLTYKLDSLLCLGRLTEAEILLKEAWYEVIKLLSNKNAPEMFVTDYSAIEVLHHNISYLLVKDGRPHDAVRFDKLAFQLSIHPVNMKYPEMSVTAACYLSTNLFKLQRYEECLVAAKHGIKLCQFVYEICSIEENFAKIVKLFAKCEWELKIRPPTAPYESTPSIFYHAGSLLHKRLTDSSSIHNFPLRSYVFAKCAAHNMLKKALHNRKL